MSANEQEVRSFLAKGSELGSKLLGNVISTGIGLVIAGPPGALIGSAVSPFLEHHVKALADEFVKRRLGDRQMVRAAAGTTLLAAAIKGRLEAGEPLRGDQFTLPDETDRSAADELGEHAILSMIASVEEKRIPFLANFYTALYFDTSIDRSSVPALIKVVDGLSYRGMCILNIVGRGQLYTGNPGREHGEAKAWPVSDHFLAKSIFDMIGIVIQRQLDSQHDNAIIGYDEVDPALMKLGLLGDQLFDKMKLDGMSSDDPDLIETENALKRIAAAPLGGPDLVKVFEDAASPKWSVSEW